MIRALLVLWSLSVCAVAWGEVSLQVVSEGGTSYRIYHAPDAPPSVVTAARELARCVRKATGVTLPIANGIDAPDSPLICLGDNAVSRAAGLDISGMTPESYRLVTSGRNLHILGPDTARGQFTAQGGSSNGTANGVYSFLEQSLGVRWLMPGEHGEYVPERADWKIEPLDRSAAPGFSNRRLPYIQSGPEVQAWSDRMKLGFSLRLNHGHNWRATVPADLFNEHPDWFAMQGEQRVPPVGRYKLETTHPQLQDYYAQRAVESLRKNPNHYTFSLSPSDSGGWSTSPEALALQETDPLGQPSVTPLVLDFYLNVAKRMKALNPDAAAAGYIYASYLYPPQAGIPALPDNLYLIVAPSFDYGYRLFRSDVRQQWQQVMNAWTGATDRIGYYDLPINLSQSVGAPEAPGLDILAYLMPRLHRAKVKSVYIYGQTAWGTGAMANYLLAKLMWDPTLDVRQLAQDYCLCAYGPSAGPRMLALYDLLDQITAEHYIADEQARYTLTNAMLQKLYAEHYPRIEELFLAARSAATQPDQQARLTLYEQNLTLLQWNLRQRGMIQPDPRSPLFRSDEQINAMLSDKANTLALSPDAMIQTPIQTVAAMTAQVLPAAAPQGPEPYLLRGPAHVAIYPLSDEEVVIAPNRVTNRGELVRYSVIDSLGGLVTSGVLSEQPIRFVGNERQLYFLDVQARSASYSLSVRGAAWALRIPDVEKQAMLHFLQSVTPIYFMVEPGVETFTLTLSSASPGETAAGEVVSCSGQVMGRFDTSAAPADRQAIKVDQPGVWMFRPTQPREGSVDDVFVSLDAAVPPWVSLDGRMPLVLRPLKP